MEDVAMATVRFESGAMCSITNSMLSPRESSQVRIDFERGSFELEHLYGYDNDNWTVTPATGVDGSGWAPAKNVSSNTHLPPFASVIDAFEQGRAPRIRSSRRGAARSSSSPRCTSRRSSAAPSLEPS